ncbi:hypothetical protein MmTuc01_2876 [Methanosarcina mazei Tuc01]|uniref:Uncharacterized protein n=1 Tax=Methanosarcina mazei Tuc01 TaxID=1236903 RepID=M1QD22_METMZ|nr:hypothetical protein MmTuc01_2876 [Methanosarcina mazei Tuc01]
MEICKEFQVTILRIKEDSAKRKNWMMFYRFSNIVILQV